MKRNHDEGVDDFPYKKLWINTTPESDQYVSFYLDLHYSSNLLRAKLSDSNKNFLTISLQWLCTSDNLDSEEEKDRIEQDVNFKILLYEIDAIKDRFFIRNYFKHKLNFKSYLDEYISIKLKLFHYKSKVAQYILAHPKEEHYKLDIIEESINKWKNNKKFILQLAKYFKKAPCHTQLLKLKQDRDFMLQVFKQGGTKLEDYKDSDFTQDREIVLSHVKSGFNSTQIQYASVELQKDKEIALAAINNSWEDDFDFLNEEVKKDRDVALAAAKVGGVIFKEFSNDREIVILALENYSYRAENPFENVSEELRNDKEIILKAVKKNGCLLEYVTDEFKNDREVVMQAAMNGYINGASVELRNDRELVMTAIKKRGSAILNASNELQNDREIILEALKSSYALIPKKLQSDREFVKEAIQINGLVIYHCRSRRIRNDREIALLAVKKDGEALKYVSTEFKNDREIVIEAVKQKGRYLEYASDELKNDKEIVMLAIQNEKQGLNYVMDYISMELKQDFQVGLLAIKSNPKNRISNQLVTNREFVKIVREEMLTNNNKYLIESKKKFPLDNPFLVCVKRTN